MGNATAGLDLTGELERGAHLARDGIANIVLTLLVFGQDAAQQVEALLARRAAEAGERLARRRDGAIDVGGAAGRDLRVRLFGRWIDHVDEVRLDRIDPRAVDIELLLMCHFGSPLMIGKGGLL
jgi:hypothetical protein